MSNSETVKPLFGERGGSHPLGKLINHLETYGPHGVEDVVGGLHNLEIVVALGAGSGRDLEILGRLHPYAVRIAIEAGAEHASGLAGEDDRIYVSNNKRCRLPQ